MKGGVGTASLTATGGLIVGALVVVNAAGSVVDPRTGKPHGMAQRERNNQQYKYCRSSEKLHFNN